MKTRGFTLVELLAVIVILAVLALIATPVVLSIIDDTKESAMLRSAEMYLRGVENAVMRENMNSGGNFRPNECTITSEGNLDCEGKDGIIEVEVNGEKPKNGSISFENGKIKEVELTYQSGTIIKDENGNLVYEGSNTNITYESLGNYEHKLSDGTVEAHDIESGTCSKCGETVLAPGLYKDDGTFVSWQEMITNGMISVDNGELKALDKNSIIGSFVIDKSVTSIGEQAFNFCKLTSVTIPSSVTYIGNNAFEYCTKLTSITIPDSVTYIGNYAFSYCEEATSITIGKGVTYIGKEAFGDCYGVTEIIIPENVKTIDDYAFAHCENLVNVEISNGVESIGKYAFGEISSIKSINIPATVTSIGELFIYSNLTSITVDKKNPVYDSRENCNAIIETATNTLLFTCGSSVIPESVTTIGNHALFNYTSNSITIPKSVTTFEENSFRWSSIEVINYNGTKTEWENITKNTQWNSDCESITVYCLDGENITYAKTKY